MVKQEDLVGQLDGFPLELVQKMVNHQIDQGNVEDVSVFQRKILSTAAQGGFDWDKTPEGNLYWSEILVCKRFPVIPSPLKPEIKAGECILYENIVGKLVEAIYLFSIPNLGLHAVCSKNDYNNIKNHSVLKCSFAKNIFSVV